MFMKYIKNGKTECLMFGAEWNSQNYTGISHAFEFIVYMKCAFLFFICMSDVCVYMYIRIHTFVCVSVGVNVLWCSVCVGVRGQVGKLVLTFHLV